MAGAETIAKLVAGGRSVGGGRADPERRAFRYLSRVTPKHHSSAFAPILPKPKSVGFRIVRRFLVRFVMADGAVGRSTKLTVSCHVAARPITPDSERRVESAQ
jgi:hypothetical protein